MRGFIVSLTAMLGIGAVLTVIMLAFSFFSGGTRSTGLFGWSDTPLLSGMESFITGVYNIMVYISSWVTIFVLFTIFLGVQLVFGYAYYKAITFVSQFREGFKKVMDELLNV